MNNITNKNLFKIALTAFCLYLAVHYWSGLSEILYVFFKAAVPLAIGAAAAYAVNIPMSFFEGRLFANAKGKAAIRLKRPVSMVLAILSVLLIVSLVMTLVIPEIVSAVKILANQAANKIRQLEDVPNIETLIPEEVFEKIQSIDWEDIVKKASGWLINGIGGTMNVLFSTVSSVVSSTVNLLLAFVFSVYLLYGKERISRQIDRALKVFVKKKTIDGIYYVLKTVNETFRAFIVGQGSEAVILGVLCAVGMFIFRFPYAMATGALVGLTALIPVAGAWIGAFVGALLILTVSPIKALLFLVYIVVLQQLENNLIYPKVVGTSIGLPGIWVLASITVGGGTLGIAGMLLGVPLTASVYKLLKVGVCKAERRQSDNLHEEISAVPPNEADKVLKDSEASQNGGNSED